MLNELVIGQDTSVSRAKLVASARGWIGTPFRHQASVKGQGVDCGGLIRGVLLEVGLLPSDYVERMPRDAFAYARRPDGVTLKRYCDQYFEETGEARFGDIALFRYAKHPQHLAFFGDYVHGGLSLIHALGADHPNKVIEHRFDSMWSKRLVGVYKVPGVTE